MSFDDYYNDQALRFYSGRATKNIPVDDVIRNCSPTHLNPISRKQMQFNSWTNFTSDNSDNHLPYSRNVCGNKTPRQLDITARKKMAWLCVPSD